MTVLTANDLKTKGVSDIERLLQEAPEVVISVRGKSRYVVMDIARYDYLRECEIAAAWAQSRADVKRQRQTLAGSDTATGRATLALQIHLERIALHRPLAQIVDPHDRAGAACADDISALF